MHSADGIKLLFYYRFTAAAQDSYNWYIQVQFRRALSFSGKDQLVDHPRISWLEIIGFHADFDRRRI